MHPNLKPFWIYLGMPVLLLTLVSIAVDSSWAQKVVGSGNITISDGVVSSTSNLAGGSSGQYPQQTGSGSTTFVTPNAANGPAQYDGSGNLSVNTGYLGLGTPISGAQFQMDPVEDGSGSINVTGEIRMLEAIGGGSTPLFGCKHSDSTKLCWATDSNGDSYNRFTADVNGTFNWGPGTSPLDNTFFRKGFTHMELDANLDIFNLLLNGANPRIDFPGTTAGLAINGTGGLLVTNNSDTLYMLLKTNGTATELDGLRSDAPFVTDVTINPFGGNVIINAGSSAVYRCSVAGAARAGTLTTVSTDCGTAVDTGLRIN